MGQIFKFRGKTFLLILLLASLFCQQALAVTVVYPSDGSDGELLAAKEVRRYIYMRTDQVLTVQGVTSLPGSGDLILVANDDDAMVESLRSLINHTTNPNGYIIKSVSSSGRDILVITGNDSTATLHAAYRYAEHLGCGFDLAGDAIPDTKITLDITGLDEVGEPLFETNGFLPYHDFFQGPDVWSTDDYKSFISQISKMGMNFIGLHSYSTWSCTEDKDHGLKCGPEPHPWIGLPGDINADGTVSWAFPAYYRHTKCPDRIWGSATWDTDQFGSGTSQLFDRNDWGSDVFGTTMPAPGNSAAWIQVHNNVGQMFKEAFGHAKKIGVKTAMGTELTMGKEPSGPEVGYNWARVMPPALQNRVSNPYDADTVRDVYTAVFDRIAKTHDLDYYWLWSWEVWSMWGVTTTQINAFKDDMNRAMEALSALGNPFQICHAGWIIGTTDNPAEFDNFFSPEVPFLGLWDEADSFEDLQASRVKWPATWMEEDWGLCQPQIEVNRVWRDVKAAWNKNCDGMIAKHWRTKAVHANANALREILWCYGPTGTPVTKGYPANEDNFIDDVYLTWATQQFGPEAAQDIADILSAEDTKGTADQTALPVICDWESDSQEEFVNFSPGVLVGNSANWTSEQSKYSFVDDLVALRNNVVGAGNKARYEYLLDCMESFKLMAEFCCVRDDYDQAMYNENWNNALNYRINLANLFEQFMTMLIERTVNATDLGDICHMEIVNWHQMIELMTDSLLEAGLGGSLPSDAYPTMDYLGSAFVKVVPALTQIYENEDLTLEVLIMDSPSSATLHYRPLGGGSYTDVALTHVARGVYEVTIPAQMDDFEYYIDAVTPIGNATFPVTAPSINHTVVVLTPGGCPPETDPPSPDPMTWASAPSADSSSAVSMTATTATDDCVVQYFFDETSGNPGGSDSGWQSSTSYTDSGLNASTQYCYQVKARDMTTNQNETAWSTNQCATTEPPDTTPPTPDPMTWAAAPSADDHQSISMTATTATDPSGVEYFFNEITGGPGSTDSGWQSSASYTDSGLSASTQYTYTVTARDVSPNYNETAASTDESATTQAPPVFKLDFGKVSGVGSSWTNVTLSESYTSPVVVAVANYDNTSDPAVVRIRNASGNSFDVRVDAAGGAAPSGLDVHYMVVEEGVYTVASDGVKMEAVKYTSTVTDENNSWTGEPQTYSNSYTSPVVLGQVMTYADAGFSTFWCYGSARANPPDTTNLNTGKSVAEDTDTTRNNETVGYIVIEAGSGTMAGTNYVAALGADGVAGVTNSPPYTYSISGLSDASVGIASLSAMDGGNGGWALLYGANPVTASAINIAIDEDIVGDTERSHTGEQVAYIVFEEVTGPDTDPPTPDPMTWASVPAAGGTDNISMTATTATDPSGVEYNFDETSGNPGGTDSGWQDSTSYTDTGLNAGTQYCYQVTARDKSVNQNATAASTNECATTEAPDTTPPTPDPMTWASVPAASSSSQIDMTATTATDPSGVEYFFDETTSGPGATDSGWQSSTSYSDTGLDADTQYCYRVQARDMSVNQNATAWSGTDCATTEASGWTQIIYDDFESGFGNWNDGGADCLLYTEGTYAHQGSNAIDLQDNSAPPASTAYTNNLVLSRYAEIKVDFWYYPLSFDNSAEDFWLDISTDGGSNWTPVEEWNVGDEFENGSFYPESVTITGYTLTNTTQLRFRCDASGNADDVYIDEVDVSAGGEPAPDTDPPTPNPATWASVPAAGGADSVSMTATTGTDPSGVEYYFDETSGNPGGSDSGWQTSASYTDSGLDVDTQYCYRVQMRDQSANQNTGSWSTTECATTSAGTWQKVDERDASVTWAGDWDNMNWGSPAYMGTIKVSTNTGSSGTYSFTGTQARCYVLRESTQTLDFYVDDEFQQQVEISGAEASVVAYESGTLSSGPHTLKVVRVAGEAKIDAFEHYGP